MRKTGVAELPLHYGVCPRWLFRRMVGLCRGVSEILIMEFGVDGFLRRIANPFFFQSLGCAVGFDFHSSGLTTTLTAALKEALRMEEHGVAVCGGKGKASRRTPEEIEALGRVASLSTERLEELKYSSRAAAKVDNTAIQAGYPLYHHAFFVGERGKWAVVQQGMNVGSRYARRYHWLSEDVKSFVVEPHSAIVSDVLEKAVLNLTSSRSVETQRAITDLSRERPGKVRRMIAELRSRADVTLLDWIEPAERVQLKHLFMPERVNWDALRRVYEVQPSRFEEVLMTRGMGPSTVRALALVSNLVYGTELDWRDPAKYGFCVGGKDGVPFPVDRETYDEMLRVLMDSVKRAKAGDKERLGALRRLSSLLGG